MNIKEFLVTILSEAKRPQIQCLSLEGEFWVCSEANSRMVKNSFQRGKGYLGNSLLTGRTGKVNKREMLSLQASYSISEGYFPKVNEEEGFCCFMSLLYPLFDHVREVLPQIELVVL